MTKDEFFHSTPKEISVYINAYKEQKEYELKSTNYQSWLTGSYVLQAINCAFSKNGNYPENPLLKEEKSIESIEKRSGRSKEEMQQELRLMELRVMQANANIEKIGQTNDSALYFFIPADRMRSAADLISWR